MWVGVSVNLKVQRVFDPNFCYLPLMLLKILRYEISFICLLLFCNSQVRAENIRLEQCGRIVGHEMGLWDYFQLRPSPNQVDKVLEGPHRFFKISLRKAKDGVWIVNHDSDIIIKLAGELPKKVKISELTWLQILQYRHDPHNYVPIYRLSEYIKRDRGQICWMFGMKDPADETFIKEIQNLHLENRTVVVTTIPSEYDLMTKNAQELGLQWTIRVNQDPGYLLSLKKYFPDIWAVEVDPTPQTQNMVNLVKSLKLKTYVDSMRYSQSYELIESACDKVFKMGVDYTQTNRPLECLYKKH